ncbi:hypothetical protein MBORA_09760 [Methanobrevibacter oralis]|uniref:Uncharacterized protein n=1 Tax=Methanobrevibacter oralis TaxID=66851 RepID=A0A166BA95_METOA|nr:hypothetical protein MBORA_09760 [Methanobrevibacter oralis]
MFDSGSINVKKFGNLVLYRFIITYFTQIPNSVMSVINCIRNLYGIYGRKLHKNRKHIPKNISKTHKKDNKNSKMIFK